MNEEKLLKEDIIINLLEWLSNQSKDTIENISKIVNKKKREFYPENRKRKLGEQSKKIELDLFYKIVNNEEYDKLKLCYKIMYFMGLRISESVKIQTNDIIDNELTIKNKKGKRKETRTIPRILRNEIKKYIEDNKKKIRENDNYLFYAELKKGAISEDWVRTRFRENTIDLGINKIYDYSTHKGNKRRLFLYSTHSLRHSFANRFYKVSGNDIEKTRIAMRHSLIKDTQTYIRGDLSEVNKIMEII